MKTSSRDTSDRRLGRGRASVERDSRKTGFCRSALQRAAVFYHPCGYPSLILSVCRRGTRIVPIAMSRFTGQAELLRRMLNHHSLRGSYPSRRSPLCQQRMGSAIAFIGNDRSYHGRTEADGDGAVQMTLLVVCRTGKSRGCKRRRLGRMPIVVRHRSSSLSASHTIDRRRLPLRQDFDSMHTFFDSFYDTSHLQWCIFCIGNPGASL
jgi:hypothetical protein